MNRIVVKFINAHLQTVKDNESKTGIPFLAALAQSALETGWGMHVKGNNFFGIKAGKGFKGQTQKFLTHEVIDGKKVKIEDTFRAYNSYGDSLESYSGLIKKTFPKALEHKDPVKFVESLQTEHEYKYATDPLYVDKIKSIIKTISGCLSAVDGTDVKAAENAAASVKENNENENNIGE